jgi:hypothetical protein
VAAIINSDRPQLGSCGSKGHLPVGINALHRRAMPLRRSPVALSEGKLRCRPPRISNVSFAPGWKNRRAYTAARANLERTPPTPAILATSADRPGKDRLRQTCGMSDAAIKKATGCDWESGSSVSTAMVRRTGLTARSPIRAHRLQSEGLVDADGHRRLRRIKGLRAIGQRRDGGFEANEQTSTRPRPPCSRVRARARPQALADRRQSPSRRRRRSVGANAVGRRYARRSLDCAEGAKRRRTGSTQEARAKKTRQS